MNMRKKQWAVAVAAVMGLVGCGGESTYVYDVEFDAAALANVPTECVDGNGEPTSGGSGAAQNLAAQQRWTLKDARYGGTILELPDLNFSLPAGPYDRDEDAAPDVLEGSSPDMGPIQYAELTSGAEIDYSYRTAFSIFIENESLEDGIRGYISLRHEQTSDVPGPQDTNCTSKVPFTSRRVQE
jgi:hypothetical protein